MAVFELRLIHRNYQGLHDSGRIYTTTDYTIDCVAMQIYKVDCYLIALRNPLL